MIIFNCEQLSDEWFAARAGLPTASNFDKIITSKGEQSKQRKKYLHQLAGEKITGVKENGYVNAAMERGVQLESEAVSMYELVTDKQVKKVGLCYLDEKKDCGCSPDGLVGEDGGIEIKCPSLAVHVGYLLDNKLPADHFQQIQGCLFVTGRKWWDYISYYPGVKPLIVRVERDETFIESLRFNVNLFCKELEIIINRIK